MKLTAFWDVIPSSRAFWNVGTVPIYTGYHIPGNRNLQSCTL